MKEILQLFKLTLGEKKRLSLAFLFSSFVAFFTYVFINLIQPIIDKMFLQRAGPAAGGKEGLIGFVFKKVRAAEEQFIWIIPLLLVIVGSEMCIRDRVKDCSLFFPPFL